MWRLLLVLSACIVNRKFDKSVEWKLFLRSGAVTSSVELGYHFAVDHNCTCDEVKERCDTYCCCDPDCSPVSLSSFNSSCEPDPGKHPLYNCSRNFTAFDSPFHDFLCIQSSSAAFLGDYHKVPMKIETLYDYDQLKSEQGDHKPFEDSDAWRENNTEHYKVGVSIKTIYDKAEGIVGKLSLPTQSLLGDCITSHVMFLKDSNSVCNLPINQTVCLNAKNTYLDHQMYIMTSPVIASESNFPQVLSENNFLKTADTETNYHFTNQLERYINIDQPVKRQQQSENIRTLAKMLSKHKSSDSIFHTDDFSPYDKVQSVAHLDPDGSSCNNLVLEVRYELFWSGSQILKVHTNRINFKLTLTEILYQVKADVLLGNVSLQRGKKKEGIVLRQHFQAGPDVSIVSNFLIPFSLFVFTPNLKCKEDKWEHLNLSRQSSHTPTPANLRNLPR